MREMNRWGLAACLAAALAFYGNARAQTTTPKDTAAAPSAQSDKTGTMSQHGASSTDQTATPGTAQSAMPSTGESTTAGTAAGEKPKVKKSLASELEKLHAMNQAEINMGQMAEQQGHSQEVKDYGKKITEDHQKFDAKLESQASTLGVDLKGKEFEKAQKSSEKEMSKLQGKSGAAFDKAFLSMAVNDHARYQKDVQSAAKEAKKEKQESLATLLAGAEKGLKHHHDEAMQIQKTVKSGAGSAPTGTGTTGGSSQQGTGSTGSMQQGSDMGSHTGTTGKGSDSSGMPR